MPGNNPLISVVVPIYKVEAFLARCIESIISQTYRNIEIILVDDGSPDNCSHICDEYKNKDNRIIVIHQANCGLSGARNNGIALAKGEFITFIDSDDYVHPNYIEQLYLTLSKSNKKISACSYTHNAGTFTETLTPEYKSYSASEAIKEILTEGDFQPSAWGKLYAIDLFQSIVFPLGKLFEDYYTAPRLYHLAGGLAYVNAKLYFYNNNDDSITKSAFNYKQMQYFEMASDVNEFIKENYSSLVCHARNRDVNVAIAYYKKMAKDHYTNAEHINEVVEVIRSNYSGFMKSYYPKAKKMAAVMITLFPNLSRWILSLC